MFGISLYSLSCWMDGSIMRWCPSCFCLSLIAKELKISAVNPVGSPNKVELALLIAVPPIWCITSCYKKVTFNFLSNIMWLCCADYSLRGSFCQIAPNKNSLKIITFNWYTQVHRLPNWRCGSPFLQIDHLVSVFSCKISYKLIAKKDNMFFFRTSASGMGKQPRHCS